MLDVFDAEHPICDLSDVLEQDITAYMARVGDNCVFINNSSYILYSHVWVLEGGDKTTRCVRNDDNVLAQGTVPYSSENLDRNQPSELLDNLKMHSYMSKGDAGQSVITIEASNTDVIHYFEYEERNNSIKSGILSINIPNTSFFCYGNIYGRVGEGQMKAEHEFCLDSPWANNESKTFLFVRGSGWISQDASNMYEDWGVKVPTRNEIEIRKFADGVVSSTSKSSTQA
ncbi:hypothetical protein BWQ96_00813 [Gracilariopsis chorda]|uniref:Uncharacterized protein n=1 Tax=Gracilariopsis chorda TaxID=448386 RepID=A0A2V3J681_9FLOR|nr:hypothetical protein BWQ96_00813 [Gracilariopsis chorda]|eukprot:PXF49497.1 hypothetical protein BWQ96_00813 [Gracilariopsis chorda]